MAILPGIFGFPAKPRGDMGAAVVNRLLKFATKAGRVVSSLISVDDNGNLSTPGSVSAGAAVVREESTAASFGYTGLAAGYKAVRQFSTGETIVGSKQTLTMVGDSDNADPTFAFLADGMQVFRGAAGGETPEPSAVMQVGAGAGKFGGFLLPRCTEAERDSISSPATGLLIYNTTAGRVELWDGSAWVGLTTEP